MSPARLRPWPCVLALFVLTLTAVDARANAFVRGAFYRLGEDDPGASAGATGLDPTRDSFIDGLHLTRYGTPHYSTNVPSRYAASKLSMAIANQGLGGPAFNGFYGRITSIPADQGYALEAWANIPNPSIDGGVAAAAAVGGRLVAYNGTPSVNGFGFYETGGSYVARIGDTDHTLGPAI